MCKNSRENFEQIVKVGWLMRQRKRRKSSRSWILWKSQNKFSGFWYCVETFTFVSEAWLRRIPPPPTFLLTYYELAKPRDVGGVTSNQYMRSCYVNKADKWTTRRFCNKHSQYSCTDKWWVRVCLIVFDSFWKRKIVFLSRFSWRQSLFVVLWPDTTAFLKQITAVST